MIIGSEGGIEARIAATDELHMTAVSSRRVEAMYDPVS